MSVTRVSQGKEIGCKEYIRGIPAGRTNISKQRGGDIFQRTVNSLLRKQGIGIRYEDFLKSLGINQVLDINSQKVLTTISKNRNRILQTLENVEKIYLYQDVSVGASGDKGIPVSIRLLDLLPDTPQEESKGYFDLVYLTKKEDEIAIGGAEVKLATKPQEYHYDQLVIYLYFLKKAVEEFGIEEIKISQELELFLPNPRGRQDYQKVSSWIYGFEETFQVIVEKIRKIENYRILPVSENCLICSNLNKCINNALDQDAVVAYKTLCSKRESLYTEGCETAEEVDSKLRDLWEELQIIPDKKAYEAERELVKEIGFWKYQDDSERAESLKVKRYRPHVGTVIHPYRTFVVVHALPSTRDIFDVLIFSISVITAEPEKIKEAFKKEGIDIEQVKIGKVRKTDYFVFNVAAFKTKETARVSELLKNILVNIFSLHRPRSDAKSFMQNERSLFIGFVDENSKDTVSRVFERFLLNARSPRAISWIEKVFAGIGLRDKNILYYFFRESGAITTNLISGIYTTNEPFQLGYPSLLAIAKEILRESSEFEFDPDDNIPCTRVFVEQRPYSELKRIPVNIPFKEVYTSVASMVSLVDEILLEEERFLSPGNDHVRKFYNSEVPFNYFPVLTFLSAFIVFSDLKTFSGGNNV